MENRWPEFCHSVVVKICNQMNLPSPEPGEIKWEKNGMERLAESYKDAVFAACRLKACFESLIEIWVAKRDKDFDDFISHFQGAKNGK